MFGSSISNPVSIFCREHDILKYLDTVLAGVDFDVFYVQQLISGYTQLYNCDCLRDCSQITMLPYKLLDHVYKVTMNQKYENWSSLLYYRIRL